VKPVWQLTGHSSCNEAVTNQSSLEKIRLMDVLIVLSLKEKGESAFEQRILGG